MGVELLVWLTVCLHLSYNIESPNAPHLLEKAKKHEKSRAHIKIHVLVSVHPLVRLKVAFKWGSGGSH